MKISSIEKHNDSLRTHQIEAKAKIFDAWETYDSVMLQMPTGTGKTYLFTSLINDIIAAYKKEAYGKFGPEHFGDASRQAVLDMIEDINHVL